MPTAIGKENRIAASQRVRSKTPPSQETMTAATSAPPMLLTERAAATGPKPLSIIAKRLPRITAKAAAAKFFVLIPGLLFLRSFQQGHDPGPAQARFQELRREAAAFVALYA